LRQRKSKNITIPAVLYDKIAKHIEGTSFRSVSEYATHILRNHIENGKNGNKDDGDDGDKKK